MCFNVDGFIAAFHRYDYTCYQPQQSVQRWSTTFGWPKGLMVLVDDTGGCYCDSDFTFNTEMVQPYFMRNEAAMVVGPFLVFGILATIFLTCWSCGMMKCCCCQCCNKPPAFTKGMAGVILTFITVALGGAAAILAIRGIASSTQQDVALTALKESFADFALWPNTTVTQVDENYDELRATMQSGRALEVKVRRPLHVIDAPGKWVRYHPDTHTRTRAHGHVRAHI